jgi:hypothetical protein
MFASCSRGGLLAGNRMSNFPQAKVEGTVLMPQRYHFHCKVVPPLICKIDRLVINSPVRYAKFLSIRYLIDINIFRNLLIDIDIDIFQNLLIDIDIDIFQNSPIDIDIDIDIFQNSLIDIDIDIDIFRMALSISIFSKFADISTIDINIRYSIHKSGEKTPK